MIFKQQKQFEERLTKGRIGILSLTNEVLDSENTYFRPKKLRKAEKLVDKEVLHAVEMASKKEQLPALMELAESFSIEQIEDLRRLINQRNKESKAANETKRMNLKELEEAEQRAPCSMHEIMASISQLESRHSEQEEAMNLRETLLAKQRKLDKLIADHQKGLGNNLSKESVKESEDNMRKLMREQIDKELKKAERLQLDYDMTLQEKDESIIATKKLLKKGKLRFRASFHS